MLWRRQAQTFSFKKVNWNGSKMADFRLHSTEIRRIKMYYGSLLNPFCLYITESESLSYSDFLLIVWTGYIDVGGKFWMLVTEFRYCPTLMIKDRGCWWQKWRKPSPIFQSCRQHITSPTSVTNIDVAGWSSDKKRFWPCDIFSPVNIWEIFRIPYKWSL